jgi:hypothetical protein
VKDGPQRRFRKDPFILLDQPVIDFPFSQWIPFGAFILVFEATDGLGAVDPFLEQIENGIVDGVYSGSDFIDFE